MSSCRKKLVRVVKRDASSGIRSEGTSREDDESGMENYPKCAPEQEDAHREIVICRVTSTRRRVRGAQIAAILTALALVLPAVPILVRDPVSGAKPVQHVAMGDIVLGDMWFDNSVSIDGIEYPVNAFVNEALHDYPQYYLFGTIGPDGYPDMIFGQMYIHPDTKSEGGTCSYEWFEHLLQNVVAVASEDYELFKKTLAFTYGFMSHAAGDMFVHTFVNYLAGGNWSFVDNAVRHMVVEGYVNTKTTWTGVFSPPVLTSYEEFVNDESFNRFLLHTFIHNDWARSKTSGPWANFFEVFLKLKDGIQSVLDDDPWWLDAIDWAITVSSGFTLYDQLTKTLEQWLDDIDECLEHWIMTSSIVAYNVFMPNGDSGVARTALKDWFDEALKALIPPLPYEDIIERVLDSVKEFFLAIVPDAIEELWSDTCEWVGEAVDSTVEYALDFVFETTTGLSFEEWKLMEKDPVRFFGDSYSYLWDDDCLPIKGGSNVKAYIDAELAAACPDEGVFYPERFNATYNTIVMSKLMLLDGSSLNDLLRNHGQKGLYANVIADSPSDLTLPNTCAMRHFIRSLDAGNQWMTGYGDGMPMWDDPLAREGAFKKIFHLGTTVRVDPDQTAIIHGDTQSISVAIQNTGNREQSFEVIVSTDGDSGFTSLPTGPISLGPGETRLYTVYFSYTGLDEYAGGKMSVYARPSNAAVSDPVASNQASSVIVSFKDSMKNLWLTVDEPKVAVYSPFTISTYPYVEEPVYSGLVPIQIPFDPVENPALVNILPMRLMLDQKLYVSSRTPMHLWAWDDSGIQDMAVSFENENHPKDWVDLSIAQNAATNYLYAGYEHQSLFGKVTPSESGYEIELIANYWFNFDKIRGVLPRIVFEDGEYSLRYKSVNGNGESNTDYLTVYLDNSPPFTQLSIGDPKVALTGSMGINPETPLSLSPIDNGSGVDKTYFRIDHARWSVVDYFWSPQLGWIPVFGYVYTPQIPWREYAGPFDFSELGQFYKPDEAYLISWYSEDRLGNTEKVKFGGVTMIWDNRPPRTQLCLGSPNCTATSVGARAYVTGSTPLTLSATDGPGLSASGVKSTYYRVHRPGFDSGWIPYSGSFTLSGLEDGEYEVEFFSEDNAGNTEDMRSDDIILDTEAPESILEIGDPKVTNNGITYVESTTPFTIRSTDFDGSGVNSTVYWMFSSSGYISEWRQYTGPFTLGSAGSGCCVISYKSIDNVTNSEEVHNAVVYLSNVRMSGYVFLDRYMPGVLGSMDPDETGLGSWRVTMEGRSISGPRIEFETYSDNVDDVGYYEFPCVPSGAYWVNITILAGFYFGPYSHYVVADDPYQDLVELSLNLGVLVPEPDPAIPFVLEAGWNMWSMPVVVEGLTAKSLLAEIGPSGFIVARLEEATDLYQSYVVGDSDEFDFPIVMGDGYYVYATARTAFTLIGVLQPNSEMQLSKGWNLIGYNALEATRASELLASVEGALALAVASLDSRTGEFMTYVVGDSSEYDFWITPGRAYFIWVADSATLVC